MRFRICYTLYWIIKNSNLLYQLILTVWKFCMWTFATVMCFNINFVILTPCKCVLLHPFVYKNKIFGCKSVLKNLYRVINKQYLQCNNSFWLHKLSQKITSQSWDVEKNEKKNVTNQIQCTENNWKYKYGLKHTQHNIQIDDSDYNHSLYRNIR